MDNDDDLMPIDEFLFDSKSGKKTIQQKISIRRKRSTEELFVKVKEKMVMRIYGVSRSKAREIIADRDEEKKVLKSTEEDYSQEE